MTLQKIPTGIKFPLYEGVKLINAAIEAADKAQQDSTSAKTTSENALATSQSAETKAESVQEQYNQMIIDGDSSPMITQALAGTPYTTLKEKHDAVDELLAENEQQLSQTTTDIYNIKVKKIEQTDLSETLQNQILNNTQPLNSIPAVKSVDFSRLDDLLYEQSAEVGKQLIEKSYILGSDMSAYGTTYSGLATRAKATPFPFGGIVKEIQLKVDIAGTGKIKIFSKNVDGTYNVRAEIPISVVAGVNTITVEIIVNKDEYIGFYSSTVRLAYISGTGLALSGGAEAVGNNVTLSTNAVDIALNCTLESGILAKTTESLKSSVNAYADILTYYNESGVIDQKDFTAYTSVASDAGGRIRLIEQPSPISGEVKVHGKFVASGTVDVLILERNGTSNNFIEIARESVSVTSGSNEISTDLIIKAGQFVGIYGNGALYFTNTVPRNTYYLNSTGGEVTDYTAFTKSTTIDLSYYYDVVPSKPKTELLDKKLKSLESSVSALEIGVKNYKAINTVYIEKFIGNVLPTPPFGTWLISGSVTVSDGVTLSASSYLELDQPMHFDSDGIKWRIRLDDIASRIRIQRNHATQGSIAELDNGVLKIFNVAGDTVLTQKTVSFPLVAGREYNVSLEVFAEILTLKIADTVTGDIEGINYVSTGKGTNYAGRSWNNPRIQNMSGSFKVMQFDYFSKLPRSPKVIALGDSILEGDTIRNEANGGYTKRWAGLTYDAVQGDMAILGTAGETSSGVIAKLPVIEESFREPEYVLLAHMTNDSDFNTWKTNTEQLITWAESIKAIPVICMMPMRSGREVFYDAVLDWVIKSPYKVIWFNRALTVNGDGKTHDAQYYLADDLHPNVLGHARMFEQVKVDLEEVFS